MTSFLRPFTNSLKDFHDNGFDWHDSTSKTLKHSIAIASIATLNAPARAVVQHIMQYNGAFGYSSCEHPGETCRTGLGFTRVYPPVIPKPVERNKTRMLFQAWQAVNDDVKHVNEVKGPSIAALIPSFDTAKSCVPDYMHVILLRVFRMLLTLWFDSKFKDSPFYIKISFRREIGRELQQIFPPDHVTQTPREVKYMHFWKASKLRECLTSYFPILLKDILRKRYYNHFLILVIATTTLLKSKISLEEINAVQAQFDLFIKGIHDLYGRSKCSFNVHSLTHMAQSVQSWGPL